MMSQRTSEGLKLVRVGGSGLASGKAAQPFSVQVWLSLANVAVQVIHAEPCGKSSVPHMQVDQGPGFPSTTS